ncbi:hypothetical protein L228DRAFT_238447 [Xylona heveae TC161]|uniref:BTB domain-containing protein n=1 Tax=Xylona heveae (strain CBS 132557 / TC161) TaxID=1328760 RepID=A0A165GRC2_XYLHT|nr:hypothetical protein L228DRAFT_238447 [Xylona heveae TC161]KZF22497.1 hypothetical protein L228DRAFT_238447 [Xylona heveae TC161]
MPGPRFLNNFPAGNATIVFNITAPSKHDQQSITFPFHNLNQDILSQRCPLLAGAFEEEKSGNARLELSTESPLAAEGLLRYLYTGDYLNNVEDAAVADTGLCADATETYVEISGLSDEDDDEDADFPDSLSLHVEMCRLGFILDINALQKMARWRFSGTLEESCSHPHPPPGLCEAIRLVYSSSVLQDDAIKDTLVSYCVDRYLQHHLGDNEFFKDVVFKLPRFASDLRLCCRKQDFKVEAAADIIRLISPDDVVTLPENDPPKECPAVDPFPRMSIRGAPGRQQGLLSRLFSGAAQSS